MNLNNNYKQHIVNRIIVLMIPISAWAIHHIEFWLPSNFSIICAILLESIRLIRLNRVKDWLINWQWWVSHRVEWHHSFREDYHKTLHNLLLEKNPYHPYHHHHHHHCHLYYEYFVICFGSSWILHCLLQPKVLDHKIHQLLSTLGSL